MTHDELATLLYRAHDDLHAALVAGTARLDRDAMAMQPVFAALQAGAISTGKARDALRRWVHGLRIELPEHGTVERVTGLDACDVCGECTDPAVGCERHYRRGER